MTKYTQYMVSAAAEREIRKAGAPIAAFGLIEDGIRVYRAWASEYGLAHGDAWDPSDVTVSELVMRVIALKEGTPQP